MDPLTGDTKQLEEVRSGDEVQGLKNPDGTSKLVENNLAGADTGISAVVASIGEVGQPKSDKTAAIIAPVADVNGVKSQAVVNLLG